jgi:hypothetical protein
VIEGWKFNPPPHWPRPPEGWTPRPGWRPEPSWGPVPPGWQLWLPARPGPRRVGPVIAGGLGLVLAIAVLGAWLPDGSRAVSNRVSNRVPNRVSEPGSSPGSSPVSNPGSRPIAVDRAPVDVRPSAPATLAVPPRPWLTVLTAPRYPTCAALNAAYPHGLGLPDAIDRTSGDPVTDFGRSTALYGANIARDRDHDQIACERH